MSNRQRFLCLSTLSGTAHVVNANPRAWSHEKVPEGELQKRWQGGTHVTCGTHVGATCFGKMGGLHGAFLAVSQLGAT